MNLSKFTYLGLFFTTLATLFFEVLLTRIFSVTLWYHFSFFVISIVMFGMTIGALIVFLFPRVFSEERVAKQITLSSLLFSLSIFFSFLIYTFLPGYGENLSDKIFYFFWTIVLISLPFIFSGITVTLALTKFPKRTSQLYATDLIGAALGGIALIFCLRFFNGVGAAIIVAILAGLGALFFALTLKNKGYVKFIILIIVTGGVAMAGYLALLDRGVEPVRLKYIKGKIEREPLWEKWNSFSRIRVVGEEGFLTRPIEAGISTIYPSDRKIEQFKLNIDGSASSPIYKFNGDFNRLDFLKFDLTNMVHYLRLDADVLVVGSGGGRDVISALAFGQKSVTALELNENVLKAVNEEFGDYSGHLDQYENVEFINAEARSHIAGIEDKYDVIQIALIDTWAATAAGAFVLSENNLYTIEAWDLFLDHLNEDGILTVSRWMVENNPHEIYRLTTLATQALLDQGAENPGKHIILLKNKHRFESNGAKLGTILVSREPFTEQDLETARQRAEEMNFDIVFMPGQSTDPNFDRIISPDNRDYIENYKFDITPPTDNDPYFFYVLKLKNFFDPEIWKVGSEEVNVRAVQVLGVITILVIVLTALCIILPLILARKIGNTTKLDGGLLVFFGAIGLGFILIEIALMQKMTVFLGNPTYSLSVVLFTLLISSGTGSFFTSKITRQNFKKNVIVRFILLLMVLALFGVLTNFIIVNFEHWEESLKILAAVILMFPIGFLLGMAFPMGMKMAAVQQQENMPWFWGINGTFSVCGSVLAIMIAINSNILVSYAVGILCYIIALAAIIVVQNRINKQIK
ncbi:hypothetical protein KKC88_00755 [Patescibacteria group bacterium]|nr:hypothetical protein [Patescibacteria group bacterium]MBU1673757.1 hypothetical protein [Patescibacteria group bacterium]MBU1964097.1 hypothetical protein [Patescibacteria group bacterium]